MGGVDPDRALERAMVTSWEAHGDGTEAGQATRNVDAYVSPDKEWRDWLSKEEGRLRGPRRGWGPGSRVGSRIRAESR